MNRSDIPSIFSPLTALLERWTRPPADAGDHPLRYWQERLLLTVLLASVVIGFLAYVPSIWLAVKEGLWMVALADTLIYALILWVFFNRGLPYGLRSACLVCISYLLGLVLLLVLGPFGAGPVWLFAFPVFTGILIGLRASVAALVINAMTLAVMGLLIQGGGLHWPLPVENPVAKWVVSSVNFMLLNTVASISITVLLAGLRKSLHLEKALRASVETKHRDLEDAHRRLSRETRERQQASESLQESEGRLKVIFDSVHTGIMIIDAGTGAIVDVNPAAEIMVGEPRGTLVGKPYGDYIKDTGHFPGARAAGTGVDGTEVDLRRKDGALCPIMVNAAPVALNRRPHLLFSFLDISKLRKAEKDRTLLEKELAQTRKLEAIGTLAGGIAHDFNNILAAVIGFTELAMDEAAGNAGLESNLEEVIVAGERAKELVRQILTFSRQAERRLQPVVMGDLIGETLSLMRATMPSTVAIHSRLESNAVVMADPTQIHQVLMNLCTNAFHAMKDDSGILEVGLEETSGELLTFTGHKALAPGDYQHLWVRDNGRGMRPETMQRVFEPFFTTKADGEGTGMGLSVVLGIVQSHGGGISVESEPGKGTSFHIYLPISRTKADAGGDHAMPLTGGGERILVVDDEPQVTKSICRSLQGMGYEVVVDHDGPTALERLRTAPLAFDLVVSDMTMPGMTGDRLMAAIHALRPDMPVILCTGYSRRYPPETLRSLGAAAVAMKPLTRNELARLVRGVLDGDGVVPPAEQP